jgi:hypothetical protein
MYLCTLSQGSEQSSVQLHLGRAYLRRADDAIAGRIQAEEGTPVRLAHTAVRKEIKSASGIARNMPLRSAE